MEKLRLFYRNSLLFRVLLYIVLIAGAVYYLTVFFTPGIRYADTFLKKDAVGSITQFTGHNSWGDIQITVREDKNPDLVRLNFILPKGINQSFTVEFTGQGKFGRGVRIIGSGHNFEGSYLKRDAIFMDTKNQIYFVDYRVAYGLSSYRVGEDVSLVDVMNFATYSGETRRGNFTPLLFAICLIIALAIDIKYPLFFFKSKYFFHFGLRDPQPSDLYFVFQRLRWYAYPILIVFLLFGALW